mmetsp:Transcript_54834/g.90911  ORF Transcript_54834/g.90911 Transcript_54834/m.90911 type:complete len:92 (+) Transcript_54834:421-696(+)
MALGDAASLAKVAETSRGGSSIRIGGTLGSVAARLGGFALQYYRGNVDDESSIMASDSSRAFVQGIAMGSCRGGLFDDGRVDGPKGVAALP